MNLLHYIKGNRKGKTAHQLEKEAMSDPFLRDALDGYESLKGNHAKKIDRLQKNVFKKSRSRNVFFVGWAAACLVVLLGVATYLFMPEHKEQIVSQEISLSDDSKPLNEKAKEEIDSEQATIEFESDIKEEKKEIIPQKVTPPAISEDAVETLYNNDELIDEIHATETTVAELAKPEKKEAASAKKRTERVSAESEPYSDIVAEKLAPAAPAASAAIVPDSKKRINGKIVDEYGEPIIGASIHQKGTSIGTVSDMDGNFSLLVDSLLNNELSVAYMGYKPVNAKIKDNMQIAMREDLALLDEVVVGRSTLRQQERKQLPSKPQPVMGMKAFKEFLKKNITRPTDEACAKAKGKVVLSFYVNENGNPYDIKVKKSLCPSADKIAIDLLLSGGSWTLGKEKVEIEVNF